MVGRKKIRGSEHGTYHLIIVTSTWPTLELPADEDVIGLARTDNDLETSSWPQVAMINQKNYYT